MKKLICVLLSLVVISIMPINVLASAVICEDGMTIEEVNQDFNRIRELYLQRRLLRREKYVATTEECAISTGSIDNKIYLIDEQLEQLGVCAVTEAGSNNSREISMTASTEGNEIWSEKTYSSVYSEGVRYEVKILTAESANSNSVLYDSSSKTIHAAPGIGAGTADYFRIFGMASSGVVGTVASTIYDVFCTTFSNLYTSTIIENVSATYNWQCDTIMHYVYVETYGAVGSPTLCYVYNEVDALVLGVTTNVRFNSTDHTSDKLNYDVFEKRINGIMDPSASVNAMGNAINSYLNYSQVMHSLISYVKITGAGGELVEKNYVCQTIYPGQLN